MKLKQLEVIKRKHAEYMKSGFLEKPDTATCDIKLALVSDTPPRLKPHGVIIEALKKKLACGCGGYRSFDVALEDIFQTPPNGKLAEWEKANAEREKRVKGYASAADSIITHAELNEESDANAVMVKLREVAAKHGLA